MNAVYKVGVQLLGDAAGFVRASKEALAQQKVLGANNAQTARDATRMADARKVLGVRAERDIQREMQQTEAAYNRLTRAGQLSYREQSRYAAAYRQEITRLSNEMGVLTDRQRRANALRTAGNVLRTTGAVGAGVVAAGAIAIPTVKRTVEWDTNLSHMSNTAYGDRKTAGRIEGMRELDALINDAWRYGGGTRDGAAATANDLFGAGVFNDKAVEAILREAVKAGTANNAEPGLFAKLALASNQTMGIKPEDMKRVFGIATTAGQMGGFEVKDMAKGLPAQMAAAKPLGMYGMEGIAKLAALNQAAITTASSRDQAANNVENLLGKIGSDDTRKDFKKLGIDLSKQVAEGRMRGMDAIDVTGNLLMQQLAKDKNYQAVQKQLAGAKNDAERTDRLKAVEEIAQGTVIGKVFQDRQALMALYAYMNGKDRIKNITAESLAANPADLSKPNSVDANMDVVRSGVGYKLQQLGQAKDQAIQATMDSINPLLGSLADKTTKLVTDFPVLSTATVALAGTFTSVLATLQAFRWIFPAAGAAAAAGGAGAVGAGAAAAAGSGAAAGAGTAAAGAAAATGSMFGAGGIVAGTMGLTAGGAALVGAPILAAGVGMNELGNTRWGLSARIGSRNDRLAELDQLIGLERSGGSAASVARLEGQRAALVGDRDTLQQRLDGMTPKTLAEHLGTGGTTPAGTGLPQPAEVKGEIALRITPIPGFNLQTETRATTPGLKISTDVGATNRGAGQ